MPEATAKNALQCITASFGEIPTLVIIVRFWLFLVQNVRRKTINIIMWNQCKVCKLNKNTLFRFAKFLIVNKKKWSETVASGISRDYYCIYAGGD